MANPVNALQAQIGQLRRALGATAIVTSNAGYALDIGPDDVDAARFEQLVAKGQRLLEEGETAPASTVLGEALRLRRGEPLTEFAYAGFADAERARLAELTLVAIETRAEADLVLGRHGELVGELEALCREHPLRERLWELLMLALYRAGRQAEALRAYTDACEAGKATTPRPTACTRRRLHAASTRRCLPTRWSGKRRLLIGLATWRGRGRCSTWQAATTETRTFLPANRCARWPGVVGTQRGQSRRRDGIRR